MIGRAAWATALLLALSGCGGSSDPIRVTGSATVRPFTQAVGEAFARQQAGRPAPTVGDTPDVADASRRMTKAEYDLCQKNGAGQIIEARIGLDVIALAGATNGPRLALTRKDIYLALAATPNGKPNTARTWRDVNPTLPAVPIKVLGSAASSGTHDGFVQLLLEPGCFEAVPNAHALQASGDPAFERLCGTTRTDGAYVVGSEDYGATVKAVARDPQAVGVFGYSYLEANAATLRGVPSTASRPNRWRSPAAKIRLGGRCSSMSSTAPEDQAGPAAVPQPLCDDVEPGRAADAARADRDVGQRARRGAPRHHQWRAARPRGAVLASRRCEKPDCRLPWQSNRPGSFVAVGRHGGAKATGALT